MRTLPPGPFLGGRDALRHEPGRDRRVESVAAALERRHPRRGREPVRRGDHPEGASQLRPRRARPRHPVSQRSRATAYPLFMADTLVFIPAWNEEDNLPAVLDEL